jgi:multicomponent Na+:H+ antiporter subunit E
MSNQRKARRWKHAILSLPAGAGGWWILTGGDPAAAAMGIACVATAAVGAARWASTSPRRYRLRGALRFVPYFLLQSVISGWDVARRAIRPDPRLCPDFIAHRFQLPPGPARVFFANAVSLLPGTLSCELGAGHLRIHVLDRRQPAEAALQRLERRVAAIFDLPRATAGAGAHG